MRFVGRMGRPSGIKAVLLMCLSLFSSGAAGQTPADAVYGVASYPLFTAGQPMAVYRNSYNGVMLTTYLSETTNVTIDLYGNWKGRPVAARTPAGATFVAAHDQFSGIYVSTLPSGATEPGEWHLIPAIFVGNPAIAARLDGTAIVVGRD